MIEAPSRFTLSDAVIPSVHTGALEDSALASSGNPWVNHAERWDTMINRYLVEWGRNPELIADEDITPPGVEIIALACDWAKRLKQVWNAPTRIVPDGEGGVSFEWRLPPFFYSINIYDSGEVESILFKDAKIIERSRL